MNKIFYCEYPNDPPRTIEIHKHDAIHESYKIRCNHYDCTSIPEESALTYEAACVIANNLMKLYPLYQCQIIRYTTQYVFDSYKSDKSL